MKKCLLYLLIIFLQYSFGFANNKPIIKIYKDDGTSVSFELSEIEVINFKEFSYSNDCFIFTTDTLFKIRTFTIDYIKVFEADSNFFLDISYQVQFFGQRVQLKVDLVKIDSIIFKNSNVLFNHLYTKIDLSISEITGEFSYTYVENQPQSDTSYNLTKAFDIKFDIQNRKLFYSQFLCGEEDCANKKLPGSLNFCSDNNKIIYNDNDGEDCFINGVNLYIDTNKMIIDSLVFNLNYYEHYMSQTGSYNSSTKEMKILIIKNIPFIIKEDGTIYIKLKLDTDFISNKMEYKHSYQHGSGTNGTYAHSNTYLIKILEVPENTYMEIVIK